MHIIGIGVDLVYIPRIQSLFQKYGDRFLNKLFTKEEITYALQRKNTAFHLASAFASKEAFFKALGGYAPFSFKEIGLKRDPLTGAPFLELTGRAREIFYQRGGEKVFLALSHEKDYTISMIVITGR